MTAQDTFNLTLSTIADSQLLYALTALTSVTYIGLRHLAGVHV